MLRADCSLVHLMKVLVLIYSKRVIQKYLCDNVQALDI